MFESTTLWFPVVGVCCPSTGYFAFDLLHLVLALHPRGRLADLLHGGEEQADQDGDDGDDHEQFDERESAANVLGPRPWEGKHGMILDDGG